MTLKLDMEIYSDTQVGQRETWSNIADPTDGDLQATATARNDVNVSTP